MSKLQLALESGQFGITAEMAPPKGYDFTEQLEVAQLLKDCVHGVNVTDMQSACLKASSLGLCIPLKSAGMAKFMNANVPGIAVPQEQIDLLSSAKEKGVKASDLGIDLAAELIAKIKEENLCKGVHIMAIGAEKNVPIILEKAGL